MRLLVIPVVFMVVACASTPESTAPHPSNYLSEEEIALSSAQNVYEAIKLLRPAWLQRRPPLTPDVYMNGARLLSGVRSLRDIDVKSVSFIERYRAAYAPIIYNAPGGVILITTHQ